MNNQEPKCPCIDCITFSICKIRMDEGVKERLYISSIIFFILSDNCELIKEYISFNRDAKSQYFHEKRVNIIKILFNVEDYCLR